MELVICEFWEERKWFLAEGRFLSGLIQLMQMHFLVGEVSGRDPGYCTRRECDRWNLVLMKAGKGRDPFWGQSRLIENCNLKSSHSSLGQMVAFWCMVSGIQHWCSFLGPQQVPPKLDQASGLGIRYLILIILFLCPAFQQSYFWSVTLDKNRSCCRRKLGSTAFIGSQRGDTLKRLRTPNLDADDLGLNPSSIAT